jgi:hypothetical protein
VAGKVTPIRREPETLTQAVEKAIRAMDWLQPTDQAMVALVRHYAAEIEADTSARSAETIGLRLETALKSLGGTPQDRLKIVGPQQQVNNRLAELRAKRSEA